MYALTIPTTQVVVPQYRVLALLIPLYVPQMEMIVILEMMAVSPVKI